MKRLITAIGAALILAIGLGIYWLAPQNYVLKIPESELLAALNKKLPVTKTYLYLFQVTLSNPRIQLVAETERINAGVDITLNIKLGKQEQPFTGAVEFSGAPNYVASEAAFYLVDPVIEHLDLQGLPENRQAKAKAIITKALQEYYATHPIYRLKTSDLKQSAAKLVLKKIHIADKLVELTLGL